MRRALLTLALLLAGLLLGTLSSISRAPADVARAATGSATYELEWYTIDSGGLTQGTLAGRYTLVGTIGQPDAGKQSSGQYTLGGGFWSGIDPRFLQGLPLVQR